LKENRPQLTGLFPESHYRFENKFTQENLNLQSDQFLLVACRFIQITDWLPTRDWWRQKHQRESSDRPGRRGFAGED
jgi:hypothetical protein